MKHLFFSVLIFSSASLFAMGRVRVNYEDVPSKDDIKKHESAMRDLCIRRCPDNLSIDSIYSGPSYPCFKACMEKECGRTREYFVRQYIASCKGKPFWGKKESFIFQPTGPEKYEEIRQTIEAGRKLDSSRQLRDCVDLKLAELDFFFLLRLAGVTKAQPIRPMRKFTR